MTTANRKRGIVGAALLLIGAGAAFAFWHWAAPEAKAAAKPKAAGVPVLVATVERRDVPHRLASIGTVQSLHSVVIRPQINGILTEVLFREGDLLPKGAPLARIDDRAIAATLAQAEAEKTSRAAQLKAAEVDLHRYDSLVAQNVISRQQIDQQSALVERLKAELLASQATIDAQRVQLSFTRISSPVAGRVGIRRVDPGNFVQTSDAEGLVTVTQIDPISIVFTLPQSSLSRFTLTPGKPGPPVAAFDRDGGTALAKGRVATFDNQIDPTSGTLRLRAEFTNSDGRLWPGQFVALQIEAGSSADARVFPSRAVQQGLNGPYVFRIRDSKAEVVPLALVYEDDDIAAVADGLEAGDTVVIDGHSRLKAGSTVRLPEVAGASVDPAS